MEQNKELITDKQCDIHGVSSSAIDEFYQTLAYDILLFGTSLSKEEKRKYLIESENYYKKLNERDGIG